ncbi:UDP-glucose 6-dehydrogenase, partial [Corallococcus praedator]
VQLTVEALGGSAYKRNITVLGAAFKPHSDDVRDSPALDAAVRLHGLGAWVTVTDPAALDNARKRHPQLNYVNDLDEALCRADAVLVVTEWDQYRRELDPVHAASLTTGKVVVDGRNCLDSAAWRQAGWDYY